MKWRSFHRSLAVGKQAAQAINDIFHRIPTSSHLEIPLRYLDIPPNWYPYRKLIARSLIEWLAQSGLSLTQSTAETSQQTENRLRNTISITAVAKAIHLQFDSEIHDPDLPLLPISCYVSDGSFKLANTKYLDIITSEHTLRQGGTGAAGIVFCSSDGQRAPDPHTVRIITRQQQPGMSAYAWELLAQVIALKLTKDYPSSIQGYSDCTATISRMNTALTDLNNHASSTTAGILSSATHQHSNVTSPRSIQHVKAHPERDTERMANPTVLDKAIFLADAIAGQTTTRFGRNHINHTPHTLILEDALSEIIPLHQWHIRRTSDLTFPVLDSPWTYQHDYQLQLYLSNRDSSSPNMSSYWRSTAMEFAASIYPLTSKNKSSYWHAGRRTLRLYDWVGHGRNQMKYIGRTPHLGTEPTTVTHFPCAYCGKPDDQAHIMLECTHPPLLPIRIAARRAQSQIADKLKLTHTSALDTHLIEHLLYASWIQPSDHTKRLWLGLWAPDILSLVFPPALKLDSPMIISDKYRYTTIIRKLTRPLISAYEKMSTFPKHEPAQHPSNYKRIGSRSKHRIECLIPQVQLPNIIPSLTCHSTHTHTNTFTYSDSAFNLTDAEVGIE